MSVFIMTEVETVDSHQSNEKYGSWGTELSFELLSASLEKPVAKHRRRASQEVEEFPITAESGDTVYALVVRYSSGDSFGTCNGKGELVWAYTSKEIAEKAKSEYNKAISDDLSTVNLTYELANKELTKRDIGNVCSGYFERLSYIDVVELTVQ